MLLLQLHVGRTHAWRLSDQGGGSELAVATSMEGKGKERVASCSDSRADRQSEKEESCSDLSCASFALPLGHARRRMAGGRVASELFVYDHPHLSCCCAGCVGAWKRNAVETEAKGVKRGGASSCCCYMLCFALPCRCCRRRPPSPSPLATHPPNDPKA